MTVLVAGAGGFIGGHLVRSLLDEGVEVRAVDIKPITEWHQLHEAQNYTRDLSLLENCEAMTRGITTVYNLAADMGGIGFIEDNKLRCMLSVLINTHLLLAASESVGRFFFSSSACVYAADMQTSFVADALVESDVYPAMPEDGYGWEKLFSERMCWHFLEDFGLETRVARFHNIYGPNGTYEGGREKAPAAICRKVIEAVASGNHEIEIWGDGQQSRSFTYIDDCIHGIHLVADGDYPDPVNIGSSELVTINNLVDLVEDIAGVELIRHYLTDAPQGVRGRNSDNTLILERYGWEPDTRLVVGMERTYASISESMSRTPRSLSSSSRMGS